MTAVLLLLAAAEAPPEDQIRGWIEQLASEQWRVREEATQRLIEAGEPAAVMLEPFTAGADPEVRSRAAAIISAIRRPNETRIFIAAAALAAEPTADRWAEVAVMATQIRERLQQAGDPVPSVGLPEIDNLRVLSDAGLEMLYGGRYAGTGGQASEISGSLIVADGDLHSSYIDGSVVIVTGTLQCDYVANSLLLVGGDTRVDTMSGSILLGCEEATVSSADSSVLAGGLRVDVLENCVTIEREAPATSYSFESRHVDEASVLEWLERFRDR